MNGVDRRQLSHDEAEESLDAYHRRHAARSWREYCASSPEALAEREAERLPLEAETVAAVETLFRRHFHRPVAEVLAGNGGM